ncbi:hypothetical protein PTTG_26837 [Puccinia triticina 1-1 BBBD Race 1]|uniref:RING-type domain-containing protein n=2 Tax=Puccinia triticina TaxID=208348 RepID=A0A180GS72_PUCT1|nr:hypothetical protein PTTG_26837 [Puccinia triticina 1-1 BBBD Race 1]
MSNRFGIGREVTDLAGPSNRGNSEGSREAVSLSSSHPGVNGEIRIRIPGEQKVVVNLGSTKSCPVCRVAFVQGEELRRCIACAHDFHIPCVAGKVQCPKCKRAVVTGKEIPESDLESAKRQIAGMATNIAANDQPRVTKKLFEDIIASVMVCGWICVMVHMRIYG